MRHFGKVALIGVAAVALAAPARAGEAPLYQPAPAWVVPAELPAATANSADAPAIVVFDVQQRIEGGRLSTYTDRAMRISSPEVLA